MLAFPSLLLVPAQQAGMKVPPPETINGDSGWDPSEYPHFTVFCNIQLGVAMTPGAHWDNAKVIAAISDEDIKTITREQIYTRGWRH